DALAHVERGRGEVDHELGIAIDGELRGIGWEPDVLADVHAERERPALQDEGIPAGAEVAELVEHGVVGEMRLPDDSGDLTVVRDGGRVVEVPGALRESDDGRDAHG